MKRLTLVAAFTALSISVLLSTSSALAAEKPKTEEPAKKPEVVVTVAAGDTLTSIADKYGTTYVRIFNANPGLANPDMIDVGNQLRIPEATETLPDRFDQLVVAVAPAPAAQASGGYYAAPAARSYVRTSGSTAGNTYYQGYCTWYAKERRPDLPNMLGNGGQWTANAAARGYATGTTPQAGAIAEQPGHVMYVESVNGDGTMVISEMNGSAGFGNISTRTVSSSGKTFIY